jgi:hypothetical protein
MSSSCATAEIQQPRAMTIASRDVRMELLTEK